MPNTCSPLLICIALGLGASACGAFADAVGTDGGAADAGVGLTFDRTPYILQGQRKDFSIAFDRDPPWAGESGGNRLLTGFRFVCADDPDAVLNDIEFLTDYDGLGTVAATLKAKINADTEAQRLLVIEVAFEKSGRPQQTFSGADRFWVLPAESPDAGLDGSGGDR